MNEWRGISYAAASKKEPIAALDDDVGVLGDYHVKQCKLLYPIVPGGPFKHDGHRKPKKPGPGFLGYLG